MLDPEVADERRDEIASNARQRIESAGALKHDESWGTRKMAYDIDQRTEADYRFYRFEGEKPLLDDLDHNLKITDGVLRFRIFRVDPRSPLISPPDPSAMAARSRREGRRGEDSPRAGEERYEEFVAAAEPAEADAAPAEPDVAAEDLAEPAAPVEEPGEPDAEPDEPAPEPKE